MDLRDYYEILELPPSASGDEIKSAFRRLAHQYHPDKKNNDPYAAAQFTIIKEAYEILSNPVKKDQYLQQRWYAQSMGKKTSGEPVTPVTVLKRSIELNKYASRLDLHRMNRQALFDYINHLLPDSTIDTLNQFDEKDVNDEIVRLHLGSSRGLPVKMLLDITRRLKMINTSAPMSARVDQFVRRQQRAETWDRQKIWIILLITILISLLVFFAAS